MNRLAKEIASRGFCSRRQAEEFIKSGKVLVNGSVIINCAVKVLEDDKIIVDGHKLEPATHLRVWLMNKPQGVLTTTHDPQGRRTLFSLLPKSMPRVICIGRLDYNTEGLIILTNKGWFARYLELPANCFKRIYKCTVFGNKVLPKEALAKLKSGITIEGINYRSAIVSESFDASGIRWFTLEITEGKNREVRRLFEYFSLTVKRLIRVSYGPFGLKNLSCGEVVELEQQAFEEFAKQALHKRDES